MKVKITLIADVTFFYVDREITTGSSVKLYHSSMIKSSYAINGMRWSLKKVVVRVLDTGRQARPSRLFRCQWKLIIFLSTMHVYKVKMFKTTAKSYWKEQKYASFQSFAIVSSFTATLLCCRFLLVALHKSGTMWFFLHSRRIKQTVNSYTFIVSQMLWLHDNINTWRCQHQGVWKHHHNAPLNE